MSSVPDGVIWFAVGLPVAMVLEPWSRWVHGRVWHGLMWRWHRSHHVVPRRGFEINDVLAMSHAPIAIALIIYGCEAAPGPWREAMFGAGLGMTGFGAVYTLLHEGVTHERLPVAFLRRWAWVEAIRKAHLVHHHTDGPPYGLVLGPSELADARSRGFVPDPAGRRPEVVRAEASRAERAGTVAGSCPTE